MFLMITFVIVDTYISFGVWASILVWSFIPAAIEMCLFSKILSHKDDLIHFGLCRADCGRIMRLHIMISCICHSTKSKVIGRKHISGCQARDWKEPSTKGQSDGIFCTLGIVVKTAHICKNSQNSIQKRVQFYYMQNTYNVKHQRERRMRNHRYKQMRMKNYKGWSHHKWLW